MGVRGSSLFGFDENEEKLTRVAVYTNA